MSECRIDDFLGGMSPEQNNDSLGNLKSNWGSAKMGFLPSSKEDPVIFYDLF